LSTRARAGRPATGPAGRPGAAWAAAGDRGGEPPGASSPARAVAVASWRRCAVRTVALTRVRVPRGSGSAGWRLRAHCAARRVGYRLRADCAARRVGCRLRAARDPPPASCASRAPAPPPRAWAWHATRSRRRDLRSPAPEARRTRTAAPAWSRGACRCGVAVACAAARRGRLRGVRRSTVHIMAHGAPAVRGTRISRAVRGDAVLAKSEQDLKPPSRFCVYV
jgi:hypothetical protein